MGRYDAAIVSLERNLAANDVQSEGFDLVFLAMAHHRLGHRATARGYYDRAVLWIRRQKDLTGPNAKELAAFRAEAEAVLAVRFDDLPERAFADPQ